MGQTLLLLHGFSGTGRTWRAVIDRLPAERYRALAPDLPGHGRATDAPEAAITFHGCVEHLLALAPPRFALGGYSMGGRLALHLALAAPERVTRLLLVSTTAGLDGERERAARRTADEGIARELEQGPFERWIERWRSQPLFAADPPAVRAAAAADQLRNDPVALAGALRGLGTGAMPPVWDRLHELRMPAIVAVGARDEKFRALGRRLADRLPSGELVVLDGGHALPWENPDALAAALD
jgi:2-succinyl-6-hydroxy-2,4-cyclohexadiene-1-carboxylate synthase